VSLALRARAPGAVSARVTSIGGRAVVEVDIEADVRRGALSSAAMLPFYLLSMSSGNTVLTFALAVATFAFGYGAANAVWPSFYGEMFSTQVRFSGMAIGTQLGFLVAGFAPSIVTALGGVREGGWVVISIFTAVVCVIATLSALTARETKDVPTALLGHKVDSQKVLVNG